MQYFLDSWPSYMIHSTNTIQFYCFARAIFLRSFLRILLSILYKQCDFACFPLTYILSLTGTQFRLQVVLVISRPNYSAWMYFIIHLGLIAVVTLIFTRTLMLMRSKMYRVPNRHQLHKLWKKGENTPKVSTCLPVPKPTNQIIEF